MSTRILVTFLFGMVVAIAVIDESNKTRLVSILSWLGNAYSNAHPVAGEPKSAQRVSEYLLILDRDSDEDYAAFIATHPKIVYLSGSVYPNTIRVAITVPIGDTLEELEATSFIKFIIRNLPIFFCH